jgi:hypothetical protein
MKKLLFLLLFLATKLGFTQSYMQGDIFVNTNFYGNHDSTQCGTSGSIMYDVMISNSFIGDTLLIKDPGSNTLILMEVNNTGMNPWTITLPGFSGAPFVPDYMVSGGFANFFGLPLKFKNGLDSIDNVFSFFQVPVPNPCSYGNLSGSIYVDNNADCIYNTGDGTLGSFYGLSVNATFNGSFFDYYSYTVPSAGTFSIDVQTSYLINGQLSYSIGMLPFAYPNSCTPGIYNFDVNSTFPISNLDFALQCTSNIDVAAYIGAAGPVRPAIPFYLYPHVYNLGCDTTSGLMQVILDSRVTLDLGSSSFPPTSVNGDTLTWNYGPLSNLSNNGFWNSLTAGLHLTPDSTVNIGDTLCFSVSTNVPGNDVNASNNQYSICYPVVNSYDPNIKEVMPKGVGNNGVIPPSTAELTYTIHFQNTGNAAAINVYIIDTLDFNIIPESIEILGMSHSMTPQWLAPGVLKFNFNNINLPDSFSNEPASHGFVTFKVNLIDNISLGTQVSNTAYIYFDLNPPIVTNTVLNTLDILTSTNVQQLNDHISIYPNPAHEVLMINLNNVKLNGKNYFEIYNIAGQLIMSQNLVQPINKVDISSLSKGLYLLKTNVDATISTVKIVKE